MKKTNPELAKKIGRRINYLRTSKSMSQERLAEHSGLHRTYIGSCERGERNITIVSLSKLCQSLDVTLEEFFDNI